MFRVSEEHVGHESYWKRKILKDTLFIVPGLHQAPSSKHHTVSEPSQASNFPLGTPPNQPSLYAKENERRKNERDMEKRRGRKKACEKGKERNCGYRRDR